METFLEVFIPLFVAIDAVGVVPMFLGVTHNLSPERRRHVGLNAVVWALAICVGFMLLGKTVFAFLGITTSDFKIAGGIILLVLAVLDLLIVGKPAVNPEEMTGIVPLAMPLIAGPATLTTVLVLSAQHGYLWTTVGLASNFALLLAALAAAGPIGNLLGLGALRALSKLVMVLLAAIAVFFIRSGIGEILAAR